MPSVCAPTVCCRIFDLLGSPDVVGEYQIVDDKVRGSVVRGLSVHEVADEEETLNMLFRGACGVLRAIAVVPVS